MPIGAYTPVGDRAEGGCRPGAAALHQYIIGRWGAGVGSYGCYNPNSRAGSGWSLHREGRAIDVSIASEFKSKGDDIFHWAIDNADALGLQEIQWYGQIWTSRRSQEGIRRDTSGAAGMHYDHVHVGLADGYSFTPPDGSAPPSSQGGEEEPEMDAEDKEMAARIDGHLVQLINLMIVQFTDPEVGLIKTNVDIAIAAEKNRSWTQRIAKWLEAKG